MLCTENAEAPGWQGGEEGEYREYLTDERRRQMGCIGVRMPTNLWDRAPVSLHRFHAPGAAPGGRVALPSHTAHHARDVLRLRAGASVRVFDGEGNEFEATVDRVSSKGVQLSLGRAVEPRQEPSLRIILAHSALKGDRMELVIQKATELGVAELWPVVTARTDPAARPALRVVDKAA